jgi:hypothetical protein
VTCVATVLQRSPVDNEDSRDEIRDNGQPAKIWKLGWEMQRGVRCGCLGLRR